MQIPFVSTDSLVDLTRGETAFFLSFAAGREAAGRLTSLGFTPGAPINMLQNYGRGPLVVSVRGARVALGREEARKIIVRKD
jgi:ferrous iron transport protein A